MSSTKAPRFAVKQRVLVVERLGSTFSPWPGVIVRYMTTGDQRGKYEVAPDWGGPTRFVPAGELESQNVEAA